MRQFDHNGLMLAEYQGKLFERSNELDCSTAVFIRRFLHSDLLSKLDSNNSSSLSLDVCEGINSILECCYFSTVFFIQSSSWLCPRFNQ